MQTPVYKMIPYLEYRLTEMAPFSSGKNFFTWTSAATGDLAVKEIASNKVGTKAVAKVAIDRIEFQRRKIAHWCPNKKDGL